MNKENIKKNILDLQFQKNLIIASTSVIIAFTYGIGVGIVIITQQIRFNDFVIMAIFFIISAAVLGTCMAFLLNSIFHIKNIPRILKEKLPNREQPKTFK